MQQTNRNAGFTLIELLVAIAILGILGTVVIQSLWTNVDTAKQETSHTKVKTVYSVVQNYRRAHGRWPSEDMAELLETDPRHANQPWLTPSELLDSWGFPLALMEGARAGSMRVVSFGNNGEQDGRDPDLGLDMDIYSDEPLYFDEQY